MLLYVNHIGRLLDRQVPGIGLQDAPPSARFEQKTSKWRNFTPR